MTELIPKDPQVELGELAIKAMSDLGEFLHPSMFLVAGGFPRDIKNGKAVKDVDIVLHIPDEKLLRHEGEFDTFLKKYNLKNISTTAGYAGRNQFSVFGDPSNKSKLQIIQASVTPHIFIRDTFDIGLCQIAMDVRGNIWKSKAYEEDVDNKKMSLLVRDTISPYQLGYALKGHYPRLKHKYNWPLFPKYFMNKAEAMKHCALVQEITK